MAREADPRAELAAHEEELASGDDLRSSYVLRGAEPWFRERAVQALLRRAKELGYELCQHDAKDPDFRIQTLHDDLCAGALFASKRCVVVLHPEDLLKKAAGKKADPPLLRSILSFLDGERGSVCVVAESLRADAKVVKEVKKRGGAVRSFRRLWDSPPPWEPGGDLRRTELVQWLGSRARELGAKLTAEQAVLLATARGNDLAALDAELGIMRDGGAESVLSGLDLDAAASPFKVAEDMVRGDVGKALFGLETLWRGGMRKDKDGTRETRGTALVVILLGSLRRYARQGLAGSRAIAAGANVKDAAEAAGVGPQPMARRAFESLVGLRPPEAWERLFADVGDLERRSRTGTEIDVNDLARLALRWRPRRRRRVTAAR